MNAKRAILSCMSSKTIVAVNEIRAGLARKELTQADLADHLSLSRGGVYRRLNGEVHFTVDELVETSKLIDLPIADLINPQEAKALADSNETAGARGGDAA
tara:strand:- start:16870 stop:17172 length:303 start_codon:yes stop_codon:yes gene_type:complete